MPLTIELAHTQGFCAGVAMSIDVVEQALQKYGAPLYVRHHIVHNTAVIEDFEKRGVVFVEELMDVPDGQPVIFSAHGVAPEVFEEAKSKNLHYIDATCPLVTKVHREATRYSTRRVQTVLIGHRGHQELIGTSGYVTDDLLFVVEEAEDVDGLELDPNLPMGYLTQTTLSISDASAIIQKLKEKYPQIMGGPKAQICYATQNRQDAIVELAESCDLMIVCGSPHSSNSNRLKETSEKLGVESYIIDSADEMDINWVDGKGKVGISSGASVPEYVVNAVVDKIKLQYPDATVIQKESVEKDILFPMPEI